MTAETPPEGFRKLVVYQRPPNGAQWLDPAHVGLVYVENHSGQRLLTYDRHRYPDAATMLAREGISYTYAWGVQAGAVYWHDGTFYVWKHPAQRDLIDDIDQGMEEAVALLGPIATWVIGIFVLVIMIGLLLETLGFA